MVAAAEGAGVGHLPEDDVAPFDVDEEMIPFPDVEHASGLGRYHDPAQVVDLAGNPRIHPGSLPIGTGERGGYRQHR